MKVLIIDGYVDEPAHFGVPPYLSTYPRYITGLAHMANYEIEYKTIDQIRDSEIPNSDILVVIGGVTVPGNYMGGTPMTVREAQEIAVRFDSKLKILVGSMAAYSIDRSGGVVARPNTFEKYDAKMWRGYEMKMYKLFTGKEWKKGRIALIKRAAILGAPIVKEHPNFPDLMCELELGMGCERKTHCSFCTEPLFGEFVSRPVEDIIEEVKSLYDSGARHFRLGRISNIFAYMGKVTPQPEALKDLYMGIREVAPDLKTLHTDNANPGYMYSHIKPVEKMVATIVEYNTAGDILSMGVESFDPQVIKANNLKISEKHFIEVIQMVNLIGAKRVEGVPKLLPGINLLYGLTAERRATYKINEGILMRILESGLMIRRVNVRKVMAFPGTPLFEALGGKMPRVDERLYRHHKYVLRNKFDHPMLKRVFPQGTILRDVIVEKHSGNLSYGRQMGTYPILIGIPKILPLRTHIDCVVVDHGQRSLTALPIPVDLNTEPLKLLRWVPGIGKSILSRIEFERPYKNMEDFIAHTRTELPEWMKEMVLFNRKRS